MTNAEQLLEGETSPGVFNLDNLKPFDVEQGWELSAYYSGDHFGNDNNPYSVFRYSNSRSNGEELDGMYSKVFLGMDSASTLFKSQQKRIAELRKSLGGQDPIDASFDIIESAHNAAKQDHYTKRSQRMGQIISDNRERLHVLARSGEPGTNGHIIGWFGKLWGIAVDHTEGGKESYIPVVIGKDSQPRSFNIGGSFVLGLYQGSLESTAPKTRAVALKGHREA